MRTAIAAPCFDEGIFRNMENIMELFRHRRSVRKYDGTPIDKEALHKVLEAGIIAPTGDNFKTTQFILIKSREMLHKLAHIRKVGTRMLDTAGAAILVLGDSAKSDLWVEDASIAMAYMHLAADALGLGSCWVQMRARDDANGNDLEPVLRDLLGFPGNMRPLAILSLGNTTKHPAGRTSEDAEWERLHEERF